MPENGAEPLQNMCFLTPVALFAGGWGRTPSKHVFDTSGFNNLFHTCLKNILLASSFAGRHSGASIMFATNGARTHKNVPCVRPFCGGRVEPTRAHLLPSPIALRSLVPGNQVAWNRMASSSVLFDLSRPPRFSVVVFFWGGAGVGALVCFCWLGPICKKRPGQ